MTINREAILARLKVLKELQHKQSQPSIAFPNEEGKTIKEDIEDAIRSDIGQYDEAERCSPGVDCTIETIEVGFPGTVGVPDFHQTIDKYGNSITLNDKQFEFVERAITGESVVLIGAAGTGKTTCQRAAATGIIVSGKAGFISSSGHKYLIENSPGIVVVAYTRRAVANIKRSMPEDMVNNCITIHKLLEYQPVYYEVENVETGEMKTKMVFEATRNRHRPLPSSIHTIIFEEGSMLGTDLYQEVLDACSHEIQEIFLGDIQQLPPVFGPAILGFKLLSLPVVELTEVYRQALESPIIRLAHRILSGNPIPSAEFETEWKIPDQLTIRPWKKKIEAINALITVNMMFCGNLHSESDPVKQHKGLIDIGKYDPQEDMILLPFNKSFGTDELNNYIGNCLARRENSVVYQVVAGFFKRHFRVGEKIMYDKEDATIIAINPNPAYSGAAYSPATTTLDYWGFDPVPRPGQTDHDDEDFILQQAANASKDERVNQASHILTLQMNDSEVEVKIDKAGEVNAILLGYALTVHKAQGSEWRRVFFVCHQSHATMLQRELLYTAVTRAREELFIVCEPETFTSGIKSQRVKGNTLAEKAEFFKGKAKDRGMNEYLENGNGSLNGGK